VSEGVGIVLPFRIIWPLILVACDQGVGRVASVVLIRDVLFPSRGMYHSLKLGRAWNSFAMSTQSELKPRV
jgi:hypothetical protein